MKILSILHRAAECAIAFVLAVVTLPLLVVTALLSLAAYRTSPFFSHQRLGRGGRPFRFVKIRTLPPTTSPYADKFAIALGAAPASMRMVRRMHLDELPQLWFVLTGHMSLVGPRPEMGVLHERIAGPAAAERLSVRPGITGLWQVSVHCDGLICDRVEYDRLYVRHRNVLLDGWILAKTVQKMLFGRRVRLFDVPNWAIGRERPLASIDLTAPVTGALQAPAVAAAVDTRMAPLDLVDEPVIAASVG